jgi:catechol 2,3-dioxygenase-like lactoylglutathione lyase family enzyme
VAIYVRDQEEALAFYVDKLYGIEATFVDPLRLLWPR